MADLNKTDTLANGQRYTFFFSQTHIVPFVGIPLDAEIANAVSNLGGLTDISVDTHIDDTSIPISFTWVGDDGGTTQVQDLAQALTDVLNGAFYQVWWTFLHAKVGDAHDSLDITKYVVIAALIIGGLLLLESGIVRNVR